MTYLAHEKARFVLRAAVIARAIPRCVAAAVAVASLSLSACLSSSPPGACNCTNIGARTVTIPTAPGVLIVNAWTDFPCTATDEDGTKVIVTHEGSAGTCQINVGLTNGDIHTFSVEFQEIPSGCCAGLNRAVDASVPRSVDAGAGGPG